MNYTSRWTSPILYLTLQTSHGLCNDVSAHTQKKVHEKELKARYSMQKCGANVHHWQICF